MVRRRLQKRRLLFYIFRDSLQRIDMKKALCYFVFFLSLVSYSQELDNIKKTIKKITVYGSVADDNLGMMSSRNYSTQSRGAHLLYLETKKIKSSLNSIKSNSLRLKNKYEGVNYEVNSLNSSIDNALRYNDDMRYYALAFNKAESTEYNKLRTNFNRTKNAFNNFAQAVNAAVDKVNALSRKVGSKKKKNTYDVGNDLLKNKRDNDDYYVNELNKEIEKQKKKKKVTNNSKVKNSNPLSSISSSQLVTSINNLLRSHSLRSVENSMVSKLLVKNSDLHFEYNNSFRIQLNPQKINEFKLRKAKHPKKNTEVFMVVINSKSNLNSFPVKQIATEKLLESVSSWYWVFYNLDKAKEYFFKLRELAQRLNKEKKKN